MHMEAAADSDEALMAQFATGDAAAFERLYARHELRVWRFIRRQLGDRSLADEVMQEVWFTVAREAGRYRPSARFTTWLYTLARNRAIDQLRARRLHQSLDAPRADGLRWDETLADVAADIEPRLLDEESLALLRAAVDALPVEQREAFLLQAEGLAVEEIAQVCGTGFETIKSRLRYARARLMRTLKEHA
jgi:RNA polymerase sigma-70 factor (ECF subfamily)